MEHYFEMAVSCVEDYVLPMQRQIYEKCGRCFDRIYAEAMNTDLYTGKVIEPGHVYELGYRKCTCPKVQFRGHKRTGALRMHPTKHPIYPRPAGKKPACLKQKSWRQCCGGVGIAGSE